MTVLYVSFVVVVSGIEEKNQAARGVGDLKYEARAAPGRADDL